MSKILNLKVVRSEFGDGYTEGRLYIDGRYFCDTLEDTDRSLYKEMPLDEMRAKKVAGETAIPLGRYNVSMTYSPRFGRPLPLVEGVPCFEGVRIHAGNTTKDTAGCLLLGERCGRGMIKNSRINCERLFALMSKNGGRAVLEVAYE